MDQLASPVAAVAPPGWYSDPDLPGCVRWWDGTAWSAHVAAIAGGRTDDHSMAVFAHVLGLVTGFVGPLVIYLTARPEQRFVKHHAAEALNLQITAMIAAFVVIVLWVAGFFLALFAPGFGLLMLLAPALLAVVVGLAVRGGIAARRGEWYHYTPVIPLFTVR